MEYVRNDLQKLRNSADITQQHLADKMGVSRQTIIAIEKGNYAPSVLLALKIARFFKKPVEELFHIAHER
ncbi:helix-turn-helix transcriptional regulator [Candidatus Kaiserbacteria bacterium]|nr:helix-turn-helix transcriptional regulator [Candidatus Kaiserbacteria bacterium]